MGRKLVYLFFTFALLARPSVLLAQPSLEGINSFAYQLQNADISELASSPYDLIVMDYSADGSDEAAYSSSEIAILKTAGKKVLAYLSIGEAEDYRYYFKNTWIENDSNAECEQARAKSAPKWLDDSNPDWCGNYKVKYWMKAWQKILWGKTFGPKKGYLDRIIDAGFDGVYLDIIDGYEYWKSKPFPERRKSAAKDMVKFVIKLGKYARENRGQSNFIVVPQNGSAIIDQVSPTLRTKYLESIQGIGAEDTFFFGVEDEDNELNPQTETIDYLGEYVEAGKKVLAMDYLLDSTKISQFQSLACEEGFIPQVSNRSLDTLDFHSITGCP